MHNIQSFIREYAFLSNFYPSTISYEGIDYPTVEHAFQAAKTTDCHQRQSIAKLPLPETAKKAGRMVKLRSDWEEIDNTYGSPLRKLSDNSLLQTVTCSL